MPSIQPVTEADLPIATELVHWSKLAMTINRLLWNNWPSKDSQKEQTGRAVSGAFSDPKHRCLKAVDDDSGELLGYIVLTPRRPKEAPNNNDAKPGDGAKEPFKLSEALNPVILDMVTTAKGDIENEMAGKDYIEVTIIVVQLGCCNKGVGTLLMNAAFEYARSEKLPLFTVAEPAAQGFFEKLGMKETKHSDMDLSLHAPPYTGFGVFRLTGMIWSASS